jgi:membrane associated rhomboid family serine protease
MGSDTRIFIMRVVLGMGFAVILMRLFRPNMHIAFAAVLGAFLVGLAYGHEYLRKRRRRKLHPKEPVNKTDAGKNE